MWNHKEIYSENLPHRAVAVYMYLCSRADKNGMCFPAIKRIASDLSLSATTIKRALKDLETAGKIRKEKRFRENGGKSSNKYFVL